MLFQYRVLIGQVWVSRFRVFSSWILCLCQWWGGVEYSWSEEIISGSESISCGRKKFYHDPVVLFQYRVLKGHVWVSGFKVFWFVDPVFMSVVEGWRIFGRKKLF